MQTNPPQKFALFCTNHEVSPLLGSLKLAKELMESGYRVAYCGIKRFEFFIIMQGIEYLAIDNDPETHQQLILDGDENQFNVPRIVEVFGQYMDEWLRTNTPDVVIIDTLKLFDFTFPFLKKGIPIIEFGSSLASSFNWNYPPVFSGEIPRDKPGLWTRLTYLRAWLRLLLRRRSVDIKHLAQVRAIRKLYGKDCVWGEYGFKLKVPALVACPREYNQPFTWPSSSASFCYIGACVDPTRMTSRPLAFELDPHKKLVYCSLGSNRGYSNDTYRPHFFAAVIEAFARRPGMQLVIQTVRREDLDLLPPLPANVTAAEWVPQTDILEKAFLFITHGGWGSIRESIYMGVPMILYPLGYDHPGNAARVIYHNLGVLGGDIAGATADQVGDLVDRFTGDASCHNAVRRMQQVFREAESARKGVEFIENHLAASRPHPLEAAARPVPVK